MVDFCSKYCVEKYDEQGVLNYFKALPTPDFNFAYDIVDVIAEEEPDKAAVVWCNEDGDEKNLTFGEISELSNKAANVFLSHGIKKGDMVLLILKRHYQFWYILTALHKIGAVAIPATNLLTKKDLIYRFNAASVSTVICTASDTVVENVKEALVESPTVNLKFTVNGETEGFFNLDKEIEGASPDLTRIPTTKDEPLILYFTSGTTGQPKMVLHNHSYPLGHIITAKHWHNAQKGGLHLTIAETGWAKAVWGKYYGQWIMRCAVFVYDFNKFVPCDILKLIEKYKITSFCAPRQFIDF